MKVCKDLKETRNALTEKFSLFKLAALGLYFLYKSLATPTVESQKRRTMVWKRVDYVKRHCISL